MDPGFKLMILSYKGTLMSAWFRTKLFPQVEILMIQLAIICKNIGERMIEHASHNLEICNYLGSLALLLTEP